MWLVPIYMYRPTDHHVVSSIHVDPLIIMWLVLYIDPLIIMWLVLYIDPLIIMWLVPIYMYRPTDHHVVSST